MIYSEKVRQTSLNLTDKQINILFFAITIAKFKFPG